MDDDRFGHEGAQPATRAPDDAAIVIDLTGDVAADPTSDPLPAVVPHRRRRAFLLGAVAAAALAVSLAAWALGRGSEPATTTVPSSAVPSTRAPATAVPTTEVPTTGAAPTTAGTAPPQPTAVIAPPLVEERPAPGDQAPAAP
jgi:hypothetical protein